MPVNANRQLEQRDGAADEIRVAPYSADRKQEVVELLNTSLPRKLVGTRDTAYWEWKHERSPFGPSILLLAECEGKLVGLRAFMRWEMRADGRTIRVAKPVDSVTHPDYQRRGIFSRLTKQACEMSRQAGIAFLFNTPNDNSKPGYLKLGWREVDSLALQVKLLRPWSAAWQLGSSLVRRARPARESDYFCDAPETAESAFAEIEPDDLDDLLRLAERRSNHLLSTRRTADFFRWRYCRHPHIPYYVERVSGNSRCEGLLIYRTNVRRGLREVMIDDLLLAGDRQPLAAELFGRLRRRIAADYVVSHFADASVSGGRLRSLGFWQLPRRRIALAVNVLGGAGEPDPQSAASWSLCLGDLEGL